MRALVIALTLLLAGCTVPEEVTGTSISIGSDQETVTGELNGRSYRVSTPDGFHRGKPWPVVFAFHGWRESAERMEQISGLNQAQTIVVYPDGVEQAWAPAPYATTSSEEDLAFITALIERIDDDYPVDRTRLFATGFSNGGGFAAYLGCRMPETFRAVAPVGAAYYEKIHADCAAEPVARLDVHGTNDRTISYYGGTRHGTRYESVPAVLDRIAETNGCHGSTMTRRNQDVIVQHWQGCELPLVHMRVGGGAHVWPEEATAEVRAFFGV
ncbi:MAG: PHB depolymerase family esterase [Corynebacterium sp.]|uniref:alpha/beta hydrolase family esterase n=1 Tax=Corynebacterium sp. TaxID=1720 RepID=UPI0026DF9F3F|nr:PHB depolymerase family esterase [Corynebacterium sp.]MDO5670202.1 PHB depolymerase family esterase [Corynebacterium sp.]